MRISPSRATLSSPITEGYPYSLSTYETSVALPGDIDKRPECTREDVRVQCTFRRVHRDAGSTVSAEHHVTYVKELVSSRSSHSEFAAAKSVLR
jgi:hypothetical protein